MTVYQINVESFKSTDSVHLHAQFNRAMSSAVYLDPVSVIQKTGLLLSRLLHN